MDPLIFILKKTGITEPQLCLINCFIGQNGCFLEIIFKTFVK